MDARVYPAEKTYRDYMATAENPWTTPPVLEDLKQKARASGLWNLFYPKSPCRRSRVDQPGICAPGGNYGPGPVGG